MNNIKTYKKWLSFILEVKKTMDHLDFKEVITSTLVESPAMEAYLEGFKIEGEDIYLPTSPEFGLKKIWLSGDLEFEKIYEVSKSFRAKEDQSPFHLPEFTMLEFYQCAGHFDEFIESVFGVCKALLDLPKNFKASYVSLPALFHSLTGLKIEPEHSIEDFRSLCLSLSIHVNEDDSLNDLFQRLYLEVIEPSISKKDFVVIKDYPPFLSGLAKISNKGWAERFEFYFQGIELANGYNELLDETEVKKRWDEENNIRERNGMKKHPLDEKLLSVLKKSKVKEGYGVAIGLERIFYLSEKTKGNTIALEDTQV